MPITPPADLGVVQRNAQRLTAAIARFRPAIIPLFSLKSGCPDLIGTGVGLRAGPRRLILTATHVLRGFTGDTIHLPVEDGWCPIAGDTHFAATRGIRNPDDDTVDAALLAIDEESAAAWRGWLVPTDLFPGCPARSADRFVVAGFPRSEVRMGATGKRVIPRAVRYYGHAVAESRYPPVLADPGVHIAIAFRRRTIVEDGQLVNPPPLYGTSGGMLIWAPGIRSPSRIGDNRLAGILIEEHGAPNHLLLSTRIDVFLALIHDRLPELRPFVPLPRTVPRRRRWSRPRRS
ncbi:MAG TPA: hypothetical protein VGL65_05905 [Gemmatimonadales bacterium]|jgi:hypothetical protein